MIMHKSMLFPEIGNGDITFDQCIFWGCILNTFFKIHKCCYKDILISAAPTLLCTKLPGYIMDVTF